MARRFSPPRHRIVPITAVVDAATRLVHFTVDGTLDTREMIASLDHVLAQLDDEGGYDVVSDHRGLETPATAEQIKVLVEHLVARGQRLHGCRCAVVVSSEASYGMMRMFAARAEKAGVLVGIFWDLESAINCLRPRP